MSEWRHARIRKGAGLDEWMAAQENVSRSVELLVRAHCSRYGARDVLHTLTETYGGEEHVRPARAPRPRPAARPSGGTDPVHKPMAEPVERAKSVAKTVKPVKPELQPDTKPVVESVGETVRQQPVNRNAPVDAGGAGASLVDDLIGSVSISGTLSPLADTGQDTAVPTGEAGAAGMDDEALQARREELFARLDMWDGEGMMPLSLDDMEVLTAGMDLTAEPDPFADPVPDKRMTR